MDLYYTTKIKLETRDVSTFFRGLISVESWYSVLLDLDTMTSCCVKKEVV